ncbi:hypothetical protein IR010_08455 [Flavobacterium sp. MR2016-29]|uniref:hypothetical protein n=1 Tax=Flavobacterium sp. MR2016-29 TaxID=2783795 RepID=UPI00188AB76A|nr:hypothetical protein [Flavobacterium sp. MR2016-29]MBF4492573.1 hypothetical protein [Flavobacterium sp. MR2016-29]
MKETIQKSLIFSLLLTNIWSVAVFFIYFFERPGIFSGLKTLGFFLYSCWFSASFGLIVLLISFIKRLKPKFKIFLLTLIFWINLFFFILLLITMAVQIIDSGAFFEILFYANIIVAPIAMLLIMKISKQSNNR